MGLPLNRFSMITPQLFLGGQFNERGLRLMVDRGITAVVNMRSSRKLKVEDFGQIKMLHLPTVDQEAPSLEHLEKGVKFIAQEIQEGGKVYVHCHYGEGRGPSMVVAYLLSTGLVLEDALLTIQKVRSFIKITSPQLEQLKRFEQLYSSSGMTTQQIK